MKRIIISSLSLCALAVSVSAADVTNASPTPAMTQKATSKPAAADNTARNQRDRSGKTMTSGDQSNSPADIKITAAIRRAVVGDGSLSITAKNVKIITANGVITLRGPVKTAAEKMKIAQLAQANAGGAKVVDQLEVEGSAKQSPTPIKKQH